MKIDLTQNECELIVASLAAAITNYEKSELKDDVLDDMTNGMANIIGKIQVKMITSSVERPSFECPVIIGDKESFKKFLEGLMEEGDE